MTCMWNRETTYLYNILIGIKAADAKGFIARPYKKGICPFTSDINHRLFSALFFITG